jgi:hypothetical protein
MVILMSAWNTGAMALRCTLILFWGSISNHGGFFFKCVSIWDGVMIRRQ